MESTLRHSFFKKLRSFHVLIIALALGAAMIFYHHNKVFLDSRQIEPVSFSLDQFYGRVNDDTLQVDVTRYLEDKLLGRSRVEVLSIMHESSWHCIESGDPRFPEANSTCSFRRRGSWLLLRGALFWRVEFFFGDQNRLRKINLQIVADYN